MGLNLADPQTRAFARRFLDDPDILAAVDQADAASSTAPRALPITGPEGFDAGVPGNVSPERPQLPAGGKYAPALIPSDTEAAPPPEEKSNEEKAAEVNAALRAKAIQAATGDPAALAKLATKPAADAQVSPPPPETLAALPREHWMRVTGDAIGDAAKAVGRGLVGVVDDPNRKEWWDAPGSTTPTAPPAAAAAPEAAPIAPAGPPRPMKAVADGISAMAPGAALHPPAPPTASPPAGVPMRVEVGQAQPVKVANAVQVQSHGAPPNMDVEPGPQKTSDKAVAASAVGEVKKAAAGPSPAAEDELAQLQKQALRHADFMGAMQVVDKSLADFAGASPNTEFYKEQSKNAGAPVEQYLQRVQDTARKRAEAQQAVARDRTSPQSRLKQQALVAVTGGLFTPEQAAALSAEDIDTAQDLVKLHADARQKAAAIAAENERAKEHNATSLHEARIRANAEIQAARERTEGKGPKPVPETEAAKIVNQQQALKALDQLEKLHGEIGITGLSPVGNSAFNRYRDALDALSSAVAAGMMPQGRETPAMMEEIKKSLPAGTDNAERARLAFQRAREQIRSNASGQISTLRAAGYSPDQLTEMERQAGGGGAPAPHGEVVRQNGHTYRWNPATQQYEAAP